MQPNRNEAERLLILTLLLESALGQEDWAAAQEIFRARAELIEATDAIPEDVVRKIAAVEDRTLTTLRRRLVTVRADMRNLSAALRITSPYSKMNAAPSLSLAG